jgi:hypothetical protein
MVRSAPMGSARRLRDLHPRPVARLQGGFRRISVAASRAVRRLSAKTDSHGTIDGIAALLRSSGSGFLSTFGLRFKK